MDADPPLPTDVPTLHEMVRGLRGRVAELDAAVADLTSGHALSYSTLRDRTAADGTGTGASSH